MPETLTESFCERCGTRYTFESAAPKGKRLGKIKVLSKGFVNFVSNDDRSLDEAFAEARSDEQREQTSQQLDAFHQTFQFCMSCRQYTCANCWNEVESRCLSCAPQFGTDSLSFPATSDPFARLGFGQAAPEIQAANGHQNGNPELAAAAESAAAADVAAAADFAANSAWPTSDRAQDVTLALPAVAGQPSDEVTVEPTSDAVGADDAVVAEAEVPGMAAWEAARAAFDIQPEAAAPEALVPDVAEITASAATDVAGEPTTDAITPSQDQVASESIAGDAVDEDVALAVAAAELARLAAAEAKAEHQRQAAVEVEAERARRAEAKADLERQRLAAAEVARREREIAAAADAAAEQERQAAEVAAAQALQAAAEADSEAARQRTAADAEAQRERQAAVEAEALRQRLAVEAELEREREREAAAEAERQRQAEETLAAAAALAATVPPPVRDDRVETPIWQIVAPETAPTPDSGLLDVPPTVLTPQPALPAMPTATNGAAQATNGAAGAVNGAPPPPAGASEWPSPATTPPPQWPMPMAPTAPQWPVGQGTGRGANDDLWAASSKDVLSKAGSGVQSCTSCGLPLSASARFCRRCGTQQH